MRTVLKPVVALFLIFLTVSCRKDVLEGSVVFSLVEGEVVSCTKGSVSEYVPVPLPEDFELLIKNSATGTVIFTGKLTEWSEETKIRPGDYSAEVSCGTAENEAPDSPFFFGSESFQVRRGEKTEVSITVSLGNCIVSISCTESFRQYYPEQSFHIETPVSPEGFDYDGRAVFVAYQFSISGEVKDRYGAVKKLEKSSWKGAPATSYSVVYDVSNVGSATIIVIFDNSLYPVDTGGIDLKDED